PRGAQRQRGVDVGALAAALVERHAGAGLGGPPQRRAPAAAEPVDEDARGDRGRRGARAGAGGHHGDRPAAARARLPAAPAPAATHSAVTSQKRIVTCCSLRPASSKWWWNGLMRNRRLPPVARKYATCRTTDTTSRTGIRATSGSTSTVPLVIARAATAAPSA